MGYFANAVKADILLIYGVVNGKGRATLLLYQGSFPNAYAEAQNVWAFAQETLWKWFIHRQQWRKGLLENYMTATHKKKTCVFCMNTLHKYKSCCTSRLCLWVNPPFGHCWKKNIYRHSIFRKSTPCKWVITLCTRHYANGSCSRVRWSWTFQLMYIETHRWSDSKSIRYISTYFQQYFSINAWAVIVNNFLIDQYLLPTRLDFWSL